MAASSWIKSSSQPDEVPEEEILKAQKAFCHQISLLKSAILELLESLLESTVLIESGGNRGFFLGLGLPHLSRFLNEPLAVVVGFLSHWISAGKSSSVVKKKKKGEKPVELSPALREGNEQKLAAVFEFSVDLAKLLEKVVEVLGGYLAQPTTARIENFFNILEAEDGEKQGPVLRGRVLNALRKSSPDIPKRSGRNSSGPNYHKSVLEEAIKGQLRMTQFVCEAAKTRLKVLKRNL